MKYIDQLREGEHITQVYLCKQKQIGTTKQGKTYYSLILQDKSDMIDGKIWELSGAIHSFEVMDYIQVEADVTSFAGKLQLNIKRVRVADEGEYDPKDYLPVSPYNIDEMYGQLMEYVRGVKSAYLRKLLESFFVEDTEFVKKFKSHSAAKKLHHGFVGGLLQHTLSVVKICDKFCELYPFLDRDLLISAAMFHDVGKLSELSAFPENDYTDEGQLLGHIVIGCEMVGARIRTIPNFPEKTAAQLRHCILAHHGEYEYGSPKKPAIAEAIALNFADNTDAKMEMMIEAIAAPGPGAEGDWLGFNKAFDSNIRKTTESK